jgi:hypothetical protein
MRRWLNGSNIVPVKSYTNVKGSPFFNKKWEKGRILKSGKKSKLLMLKYNSYKNQLWFRRNRKTFAVVTKIDGFTLNHNKQNILFKNGFQSTKNDISANKFLRLIYDGNVKLAEKYQTILHNSGLSPLTGQTDKTFFQRKHYYLITLDGKFHEIKKLKRKYILGALKNHQKTLKKYAKNNNLDWGAKDDLKKILTRYDQLISANKH